MNTKEYIIREVSDMLDESSFQDHSLDEILDMFFSVLNKKIDDTTLNGVGERVNSCISGLVKGATREELVIILSTMNSVEPYARKVLYLIDPDTLNCINSSKDTREKGYSAILRALDFGKNQIATMAARRNIEDVHQCDDLSDYKVHERINRFLIDYIRITEKKYNELKDILVENTLQESESFYPNEYIKRIIDEYDKQEKFKYMDCHWLEEDSSSFDSNISNLIKSEEIWKKGEYGVKFLGEAGTGKTTALKRIQYNMAKNYAQNEGSKIPVYVSLCELSSDNNALQRKIGDILRLDNSEVRTLLEKGDLVLLLDGYNEILDSSVQKSVSKIVDGYFRVNYKNTRIYLSDRSVSKRSVPILRDSVKLYLRKITLEEKLLFFRLRTSDEIYNLIYDKQRKNKAFFKQLNTPYKLLLFLEIVEHAYEIPEDITSAYINHLFERERNENKEKDMDAIEDLLYALAIYLYQNGEEGEEEGTPSIGRIEALSLLAKAKNNLGYYIEPEHFERVTRGMNILSWEDERVEFTSREYLSYFMFEAMDKGVDKII